MRPTCSAVNAMNRPTQLVDTTKYICCTVTESGISSRPSPVRSASSFYLLEGRKDLAKISRSSDQLSFSSNPSALALLAVVACHPVRKDDCSQELLDSYSPSSRDIPKFSENISFNSLHELDVQSLPQMAVMGGLEIIGQRPQLQPHVRYCVLSGDNCRNSHHMRFLQISRNLPAKATGTQPEETG